MENIKWRVLVGGPRYETRMYTPTKISSMDHQTIRLHEASGRGTEDLRVRVRDIFQITQTRGKTGTRFLVLCRLPSKVTEHLAYSAEKPKLVGIGGVEFYEIVVSDSSSQEQRRVLLPAERSTVESWSIKK